MNFFQALGLPQDLINETVLAAQPAGLSAIDSEPPAPRGVIAAALIKVPVPDVIAEKFTRLERFCADPERTVFSPLDDALVLRGITTAANPALTRFKLDMLCMLLREAGLHCANAEHSACGKRQRPTVFDCHVRHACRTGAGHQRLASDHRPSGRPDCGRPRAGLAYRRCRNSIWV